MFHHPFIVNFYLIHSPRSIRTSVIAGLFWISFLGLTRTEKMTKFTSYFTDYSKKPLQLKPSKVTILRNNETELICKDCLTATEKLQPSLFSQKLWEHFVKSVSVYLERLQRYGNSNLCKFWSHPVVSDFYSEVLVFSFCSFHYSSVFRFIR